MDRDRTLDRTFKIRNKIVKIVSLFLSNSFMLLGILGIIHIFHKKEYFYYYFRPLPFYFWESSELYRHFPMWPKPIHCIAISSINKAFLVKLKVN